MRIDVGQAAPSFDVVDIHGQRIRLANYAGRTVYLSFHRSAGCPLCNLRLHLLMERYLGYARQGLRHISLWQATAEQLHAALDSFRPPFPIIADPDCKISRLFGVEASLLAPIRARLWRGDDLRTSRGRGFGVHWLRSLWLAPRSAGRLPVDFLLDSQLRVQSAHYGRDAGDFLPFSEIDTFLATARDVSALG